MINYAVAKRTSVAGTTVSVYVERIDTQRDNPDPWGDGPIVEVMVARNIPATDNDAIQNAMDEARKIVNEKQNAEVH